MQEGKGLRLRWVAVLKNTAIVLAFIAFIAVIFGWPLSSLQM